MEIVTITSIYILIVLFVSKSSFVIIIIETPIFSGLGKLAPNMLLMGFKVLKSLLPCSNIIVVIVIIITNVMLSNYWLNKKSPLYWIYLQSNWATDWSGTKEYLRVWNHVSNHMIQDEDLNISWDWQSYDHLIWKGWYKKEMFSGVLIEDVCDPA